MASPAMRRRKKDDGINLYTTPRWAVRALLEVEFFDGLCWECCCGMGDISESLIENGNDVLSTDLFDHGYGKTGIDFLEYEDPDVRNVITNPPFDKKKHPELNTVGTHFAMLKHALAMENVKKVAFFMPVQFLETPTRAKWLKECPHFKVMYSFANRVKCLTNGSEELSKDNTSKHYAWFVFDKNHNGPARVDWLFKSEK